VTPTILQKLQNYFRSEPEPKTIAQQLRQPSGDLAEEVGYKMNEANKPLYDVVIDLIEPKDNDRILEIGFGNGKFFDKLFSNVNGLKVAGIDYSKEMVEAAKENNSAPITSGRLDLQWGCSDALPYDDQFFDKVFCNMVIYFWDEPEPHLQEIHRVLKSGGRFYTGMRTRESMLNFPFVQFGFNLYKVEEWKEILIENGFSLLKTTSRLDPKMEFNGSELRLESCCVVAIKN